MNMPAATVAWVTCLAYAHGVWQSSLARTIVLVLVPVLALNAHLIIPAIVQREQTQWRFRVLTHVTAVLLTLLALRACLVP